MDRLQAPEDRLGDDVEPAVIDDLDKVLGTNTAIGDRFGQLAQFGLNLRSGKQRHRSADLATRRDRRYRNDHPSLNHRIGAINPPHVELARQLFRRNPSRHEVVLDHGQPAVVSLGVELGLALLDIAEIDLLIVILRRINGRSGKGADRTRLAFRLLFIALQLVVSARRQGLATTIVDFVRHINKIAVAIEGQNLRNLDAIDDRRFETQLNRLRITREFTRPGHCRKYRLVIGQAIAHQPTLCDVLVLRSEQREILALVRCRLVARQFKAHQIAALRRDLGNVTIGLDTDRFRLARASGTTWWNGRSRCRRSRRCLGRSGD